MLTLGNKLSLNSQPIYKFVNEHSVDFDGVDDRIITDGADTVLQNTTYSFWCKASETGTNRGVFGHGSSNIGAFHFNWSADRPLLYLGNSYYQLWVDTPAQDDGEWHHWVVYLDTDITNCKLYVDSVLIDKDFQDNTGSAIAYTESLTIGSDQQSGGNSFVGKIDEFAVYDRELTQAEITRMFNTYYSPNRIANGNFAQEGVEEVTNGDFSQIGSELVTNGDFSSGSGWSGSAGIANGQLTKTGSGLAYQSGVITSGKQYKIVVDVASLDGATNIYTGGNSSSALTVGLQTIYMTGGSSNDFLGLNNGYSTGVGTVFNSISVKEVLQDWTVSDYGGTAASASLSLDNGAVKILKTADSDWRSSFLRQTITYTNTKFYKVSFKIKDGNTTGANIYVRHDYDTGSRTIASGISLTSSFVEYTYYFQAESNSTDISFGNLSWNSAGSGEYFFVDDVTVKEVGQHWTFGTDWKFDGDKPFRDTTGTNPLYQLAGLIIGRTYKVTFDLVSVTASGIRPYVGGAGTGTLRTSVGTYSENIVCAGNNTFYMQQENDFIGSIDNIVVQELKHDATNLMLNAGDYQSANPLITSTKSMEFDGTDDYLTSGDVLDVTTNDFSISFWFRWETGADDYSGLVTKKSSISSGVGYAIVFRGSTQNRIYTYIEDGSSSTTNFDTYLFDENKWYNITVVFNRSDKSHFYINGVQNSEIDISSINGDLSNSESFNIGKIASSYFGGNITEVGTWDRALTSLEVASLYNQGMPTNLLVNRNNYQSGNPTVFNTKQVDFDGTDDFLEIGSSLDFNAKDFSVSSWYKTTDTEFRIIQTRNTGSLTSKAGWQISTLTGNNWNNTIIEDADGDYIAFTSSSMTNLADGNWHHIVMTWDTSTGTGKLYLDGLLLDTSTNASMINSNVNSTDSLIIGGANSGSQMFNGDVSQSGIWHSVLSADEVSSLYNHGLPIDLTTDQAAYASSSNLVGYWRMGSGTLDTYPLIADQTNATLGSNLVEVPSFETTYTANQWLAFSTPSTLERSTNQAYEGSYSLRIAGTDGQGVQASATQFTGDYTVGDVVKITAHVYPITSPNNAIKTGVNNSSRSITTLFTGLTLNQWNKVEYYVTISTASNNYISFLNSGTGEFYLDTVSAEIVQGNPAIMTNQTSTDIENGSPYANIVQNSDFATDSDWVKQAGWTISGGTANFVEAGGNRNIYQSILTIGKTYKLTYTVLNYVSGSIRNISKPSYIERTANGTYTEIFTPTTYTNLFLNCSTNSQLSIDNVTVEEVNTGLQGYWKMGDGTNDEYPYIFDQTNPTYSSDLISTLQNGRTSGLNAFEEFTDNGGGSYTFGSTSTNWAGAEQPDADRFAIEVGEIYKFTFDYTLNSGSSSFGLSIGNTAVGSSYAGGYYYPSYNGSHTVYFTIQTANSSSRIISQTNAIQNFTISNLVLQKLEGNIATMTNMVEGNITNQYPLTKIRNYYRMGDGIMDGYPIIQDQTSPNLAHIPTTNNAVPSEVFSSWSLQNVTVTTNTVVSPDGTQNASTITPTAVSGVHLISTSGTNTIAMSVYAKQNGYTTFRFNSGSSGNGYTSFNLATGVIAASGGTYLFDNGIEDVGNGWFRCFMVLRGGVATNMTIAIEDASGLVSFTGDGTSGIHIWGAQSEDQLQPTTYLKSDGIAAVRKSSTTNLVPYSEDFSQAGQVQNITLTANAITSPTGTSNGTKVLSSDNNSKVSYTNISFTNGTTYTLSVYCRNIDATALKFFVYNAGGGDITDDFTSQVNTTSWTRVSTTFTASQDTSSGQVQFARNLPSGESAYFWGFQLEEQTQAETYAKTTGLPVTIDLFTENNYGTMTNMSASDIVEDTP